MREIWEQRDLLYFLARRDVMVVYKQAVMGFLWAILQPILLAAVFAVFLGLLAHVPSQEGIPYPLFCLTGLVIWLSFAKAVQNASLSTVVGGALISKIYFPRILIPIAALAPSAVDFGAGLLVVLTGAIAYGFWPGPSLLAVPACFLLAMMTALGFGLWFSAANVRYRDVGLGVPFALLVGMFITPVAYPFDQVPANLQPLYALNPMVGVIEAFRWSILGTGWPGALILIPIAMSVLLLITGALYFKRAESSFADYM